MQHIDVKSSLLQAIGYDAASKTLLIEFKGKKEGEPGKTYKYNGVSQATFDKFKAAESHGKHFLKEIKPNHSCTKIEPEKPNAESETKAAETPQPFKAATDYEKIPF